MHKGRIIDADVHHNWRSPADLMPYMPQEWRRYASGLMQQADGSMSNAMTWDPFRASIMNYPHPVGTNKRLDTFPPGGGPPGSDYETLRKQLLDDFDVEAAILSFDIGFHVSVTNPYFGTATAEAANRWSSEQWLDGRDDRLFGSIIVCSEFPELAAAEARRAAANERFVELRLVAPAMGKPFGHPHYHPIYAAAVEAGLTVAIHAGGEASYGLTQTSAGGIPGNRFEFHSLLPQGMLHHVMSLVTHGVFERFPTLTVMIVEGGVAWVPVLFAELDARFDVLRHESHWVRRPPTEYLRDYIRFTTQPLESPSSRDDLISLLEHFGGMDDLLCFSSDYPHWDADDPRYVAKRLPSSWAPKLFHDNAARAYPKLGKTTTA